MRIQKISCAASEGIKKFFIKQTYNRSTCIRNVTGKTVMTYYMNCCAKQNKMTQPLGKNGPSSVNAPPPIEEQPGPEN